MFGSFAPPSTAATTPALPSPVGSAPITGTGADTAPATSTAAPSSTGSGFGLNSLSAAGVSSSVGGATTSDLLSLTNPASSAGTGIGTATIPGSREVDDSIKKADEAKESSLNVPLEIGNLSLDEVVNKWTDDVAELSDHFQKAAALVAKWDRAIVSNEDRIHAVHKDAQSLQIAHKELTGNLDVILSQQSELHHLLDALEEDVERKIGNVNNGSSSSLLSKSGGGTSNLIQQQNTSKFGRSSFVGGGGGRLPIGAGGMVNGGSGSGNRVPADVERESMHRLSAEVMEELDAMALTIRDLVSELNKGRDGGGDGSSGSGGDIVGQIIAVLNAHLDSLMYLDESSGSLQKRLTDVSRAVEVISRDADRGMYGGRRHGGVH